MTEGRGCVILMDFKFNENNIRRVEGRKGDTGVGVILL